MKDKVWEEKAAAPFLDIAGCINETCPWSGDPVQSDSLTAHYGRVVGFCNPGCRDQFESAVRHFESGLTKRIAH